MTGRRRGPSDPRARRRAGLGAIAGVLAAATALGVGQLVAGLTGANGSPVVAVGQLQIDFTPPWLKNFAINEFGSDDKLALVSGILVVLGIFAAVIGVAATRRLSVRDGGLAGVRGHRTDRRRDPAHRQRGQPAADAGRDGRGSHRAAGADRPDRSGGRGAWAAHLGRPGCGRCAR